MVAILKNTVGRPVSGGNFFDREQERARIWRYLETDNLLLLAPRRVGKTSLMKKLIDGAEANGFRAAYLSVSDVRHEITFVEKLYQAVASLDGGGKVVQRIADSSLGRLVKKIRKVEFLGATVEFHDDAAEQWADLGKALARALADLDEPWVLMVDELPVFVNSLVRRDESGSSARNFLNWFREVRQTQSEEALVRWVLAGSIGLDTVASRLNLGDTINDLRLVHLGPFSAETAESFLVALATSYGFTLDKPVRQRILERIGWPIPYYLQLVFAELRTMWTDSGKPPTVTQVDESIEILLSPAKKAYFDYWRQRIQAELGKPDSDFALDLLNVAAQSTVGVSASILGQVLSQHIQDPDDRSERLRYLLDILNSDGYLVEEDGKYQFRSVLLRDFWRTRVLS